MSDVHKDRTTFFYLDSHWHKDLPLREEIDLISTKWQNFVLMIDDFKVPGDNGFGYDDYGKNKELSFEFVSDLVRKYGISCFYPAYSSSDETGRKRGYIVLTTNEESAEKLSAIDLLKKV